MASNDHAFRFLVESLLQKLPNISEEIRPFPALAVTDWGLMSPSTQENLLRAVFLNHLVAGSIWKRFYGVYVLDISDRKEKYVHVVLYCCIHVHRSSEPFYVRLLDVLGVVTWYALSFEKFRDHTAAILVVFFEAVMRLEFYQAGGWTGLQKFLHGLRYLDWYHLRGHRGRSDVSRKLQKEIEWQGSTKSYGPGIRFLSFVDAMLDPQCQSLAKQVLDFVPPSKEDVEKLMVPADIIPKRRSAMRSKNSGRNVVIDTLEVEPGEKNEIARNIKSLNDQKEYERSCLQKAEIALEDVIMKYQKAYKALASLLPPC